MKFKLSMVIFLLLASSAPLLAQQPKTVEGRERARIDGVLRVFMHQPGDYSVMTFEKGEFKVYRLGEGVLGWSNWLQREKDKITDMPHPWKFEQILLKSPDGKLSVVAREYPSIRNIVITTYINSVEDVNGAGWISGGKFHIEGTTTVVR
jgi:hypothetical protein